MIIVKVKGGLGNQFFQYALYRHFKEAGKDVFLDISWYTERNSNREYQLDFFNTKVIECTEKQKYQLANDDRNFVSIAISKVFGGKKSHVIENERGDFEPQILTMDSVYLDGYWQRKEYFEDILNILKDELVLKEQLEDDNKRILRKINNTNSVSIHVRRGDYMDAQQVYGGICTENYYKNAVDYIEKHVTNPYYFVFSDDLQWCRDLFGMQENILFVDVNSNKSYIDLVLMSKCKNMILANSSFSWWAATINSGKDKIIVSPNKWNNISEYNYVDNDWIIV